MFAKSTIFTILSASSLATGGARDVTGEVQYNKDSCWDVGYVDDLSSAGYCQLSCTFTQGCGSWAYTYSGSSRRCHLCTLTTPRTDVLCDNAQDPCKTWGMRVEDVTAVSIWD